MAILTTDQKNKIELQMLRDLENAVRMMFEFTGWEEGRDPEAVMTIDRINLRLDQITAVKNALF